MGVHQWLDKIKKTIAQSNMSLVNLLQSIVIQSSYLFLLTLMGIQSLGIPSVHSKCGWFGISSTGTHNVLIAYLHTGFFFFKNAL